jgi:hypothetical protein
MTDDGKPGVGAALDEALMETHHLANISGLDEARLARRRLVEAQSASSVSRTRDLLAQAIEYLELAKLERRDTAAGFVQARELVAYAESGLQREQPIPLTGSPADLVRSAEVDREPDHRGTLQDLRAERAVNSFEQLRYDVELDDTFQELERLINEGELDHEPADDGDLDVEAALELASLEMDIERSIQRPEHGSEFEFVDSDDLESADQPGAGDPQVMTDGDEPADAGPEDQATSVGDEPIATPDGEEPPPADGDEPVAAPDDDGATDDATDEELGFELEEEEDGDAVAGTEEG